MTMLYPIVINVVVFGISTWVTYLIAHRVGYDKGYKDGVWVGKTIEVLKRVKGQFNDCGRCMLHGTSAEHDMHVEQNLPDPFTGIRPRKEESSKPPAGLQKGRCALSDELHYRNGPHDCLHFSYPPWGAL